jgi:hypothetical protein
MPSAYQVTDVAAGCAALPQVLLLNGQRVRVDLLPAGGAGGAGGAGAAVPW